MYLNKFLTTCELTSHSSWILENCVSESETICPWPQDWLGVESGLKSSQPSWPRLREEPVRTSCVLMDKGERQRRWTRMLGFTSLDVKKLSEHVRAFGKRKEIYIIKFFLRKMIVTVICLRKSPCFPICCSAVTAIVFQNMSYAYPCVQSHSMHGTFAVQSTHFNRQTCLSTPFPEQDKLGHMYAWENVLKVAQIEASVSIYGQGS